MILLLFLTLTVNLINSENVEKSICPDILTYEPSKEPLEWEGVLKLQPQKYDVHGIVMKIKMSHKIKLLLNWLGDTTTNDNQNYFIENLDTKIYKYDVYLLRFKVQFSKLKLKEIPRVEKIYFNGKLICPEPNKTEKNKSVLKVWNDLSDINIPSGLETNKDNKTQSDIKYPNELNTNEENNTMIESSSDIITTLNELQGNQENKTQIDLEDVEIRILN